MFLTQTTPPSLRRISMDDPEIDAFLQRAYSYDHSADTASVRVNMITSLTGAATGGDGTSDSLSHRVDRKILRAIRNAADVVLVGAQSVRAEGYVLPRSARLAIVTATGDLHGHRLDSPARAAAAPIMVLCPASREERVRAVLGVPDAEIIGVGNTDVIRPDDLVRVLHERGLTRIVCEGGPALASQIVAAGLVDEYCVSVSPSIHEVASPFIGIDAAHAPRTHVRGHIVDDAGFSYLRLTAAT